MSVARSTLLFATGTIVSRILGLVRDRVVLSVFGASVFLDAFIVAFRLPNMLRDMLAEGALGSAFTKVYSSVHAEDPGRARKLLIDSLVIMVVLSVFVCALGMIVAPWLVRLMTVLTPPGEYGETLVDNAIWLSRVLFPFLGLMILGAVAMGALHQRGRFFLTAISPVAFNLGYIFGAIVLSHGVATWVPQWVGENLAAPSVVGLALGVLLGGLGQLLVQLWGLWAPLREGLALHRLRLVLSPDLKKVLWLMGPMVLAASAGQINMVVNTMFATSLREGAVVWLTYAFRLLHFPIGIFGVAIGSAVLPVLARAITKAGGRMDLAASREVQGATELVLWLMVPCLVFYQQNDLAIVRFLFQSGAFGDLDAKMTATALHAYSYGLVAYGLIKVFTSVYFALDRTRYAMNMSLIGIGVNFAANWVFVHRFGHEGLALAYATTLSVNALLLAVGLRGQDLAFGWRRFYRSMGNLVLAVAAAVGIQYLLAPLIGALLSSVEMPVWLRAASLLAVNGVLTFAVFGGAGLFYLRMSPRAVYCRLRRR